MSDEKDERSEKLKIHYRRRLLEPNKGADVKVVRYELHLGTVKKGSGPKQTIAVSPNTVFRANQIVILARIEVVYPLWVRALRWVKLPWVGFDKWDVDPDEGWFEKWFVKDRWTFFMFRPMRMIEADIFNSQQREALNSCVLTSLKVANVETFIGARVALGLMLPSMPLRLDMPTAVPQISIQATFEGRPTCDFDVQLSGWATEREEE